MTDRIWNITRNELPRDGEIVHIITEGGMETELAFDNNLWWFTDRSMYVYYTPMFWRYKE